MSSEDRALGTRNTLFGYLMSLLHVRRAMSPRQWWLVYTIAVAATVATLVVRFALGVPFDDRPLLIFFVLPIILSAYLGGLWPGLAATLLSVSLVDYFLIWPIHSFEISRKADIGHLFMLAISGVFISILTELLHRSRDISEKRTDDFLHANEQLKKEIADRKRAEESLRESESRLRSVFLAAPVGIGLVSSRSLVDVNDTLCRMTGYSRQELIGKSSRTLYPSDEEYEYVGREKYRQIAEKVTGTVETRWQRKDGTIIHIILSSTPLDSEDISKGLTFTALDITDRKRAEEKLIEKQLQLEELNRTLEQRVDEETEKNREKDYLLIMQSRQAEMGEMINIIAHQWRQPLNTIGLYVQDLAETGKDGELSGEYLDSTVNSIMHLLMHMSGTIDDFMNFLRPDREVKSFNIRETLTKTLSLVSDTFKVHNIRANIEGQDDLVATGYPNEYAQAVLNILNNAKDALVERHIMLPRINIIVATEGNRAVLKIADNAGGIAEELLDRIFDLYFTTKDRAKGTGIGLYMAKTIVEKRMNGHLSVRNTGEGAEFRIEV